VTSSGLGAEVQKFITSPPSQFVAGCVLAGVVWKSFEKVENVLTDQTKAEIGSWLKGVEVERALNPWAEAFVFVLAGDSKDSTKVTLRGLLGVGVVTLNVVFLANRLARPNFDGFGYEHLWWLLCLTVVSTIDIYRIKPHTSRIIGLFAKRKSLLEFLHRVDPKEKLEIPGMRKVLLVHVAHIVSDAIFGFALAALLFYVGLRQAGHYENPDLILMLYFWLAKPWLWCYPLFFWSPSCFLLYGLLNFLPKVTRHFDINLQWFTHKFDIQNKPLSSLGLITGALVATIYWAFAFGGFLLQRAALH
jgi:hypothetical protein